MSGSGSEKLAFILSHLFPEKLKEPYSSGVPVVAGFEDTAVLCIVTPVSYTHLAVQSPPIRFFGDFRHFQHSPCLFTPFWLWHLLCVLYRLLHASILETQVLPQAADLLWVWCPFSFGDCTVPAYRCNPPFLGLRVVPYFLLIELYFNFFCVFSMWASV